MPAARRLAIHRAKRSLQQSILLGLVVACVLLAVRAGLKAQPAPGEAALVLAADQEGLSDAMRSGDKSVARKLLALQFTYVDEKGTVHERRQFLGDLKSVAPTPATETKVALYGVVAAVTTQRKSARDDNIFSLHIWAKQKNAWRILTIQDVEIATGEGPRDNLEQPDLSDLARELAKVIDCKNPCETIPYRVRSPAEQEVITTFQAIEKAMVAHDATEYQKHLADEYMYYRSGFPPVPKSGRIEHIEEAKKRNIPAIITAIHSMRLWVFGESAIMISEQGLPDDNAPLLRISRVWVKRNGQWQMMISIQTDVETSQ